MLSPTDIEAIAEAVAAKFAPARIMLNGGDLLANALAGTIAARPAPSPALSLSECSLTGWTCIEATHRVDVYAGDTHEVFLRDPDGGTWIVVPDERDATRRAYGSGGYQDRPDLISEAERIIAAVFGWPDEVA